MPVACAADKFSQIWPKMVEMIFAFLRAPRGSFSMAIPPEPLNRKGSTLYGKSLFSMSAASVSVPSNFHTIHSGSSSSSSFDPSAALCARFQMDPLFG